MSNSIAKAEVYSAVLDEVYKAESLTAVLDTPQDLVQWQGGNTARIFSTSLQGLGDYSRSNGFVTGDVNASWETYALAYDRGRSLTVDNMDNEETLGMAFGTLAGGFVRTKEVPELDAYTFAKICGKSGISSAAANLSAVTDILDAIDTAQADMDENEVPMEGRILFVSPLVYKAIKGKITRTLANEKEVQRNVEMLDDMRVIRVPQSRFNTAIKLLNGTSSGEADGGYSNVPASGSSYKINFLLVHPSAIMKVQKHRVPRIWTPDQNINADAFKFDLRTYGDVFVKDNKVKGVYLHRGTTANA